MRTRLLSRRLTLHRLSLTVGILVAMATGVALLANPGSATLVVHFDPNEISSLFQDGGGTGGTVPVTGVGDPVGWVTDVRSSTPGGAALDGFADAQQSGSGADLPTLANSPGGTVLRFAGADNLLGFDANEVLVDGLLGAMDTDIATLILVGRADPGSGLDTFLDMRTGGSGLGGFGLRYNHGTGNLEGLVDTAVVAPTSLTAGELFVATLAWDGPAGSATLRLSTAGGESTTTDTAASAGPIDHERFRLGSTANGGNWLTGLVGDVYLYNDDDDHSAVHDQLVVGYIPEPSTALLLASGLAGLAVRQRRLRTL